MSGCCVGTGMFFCMEGIAAASGAAGGAIGYSVLTTSNGWEVANYTCTSMTQASTVGSVILSIPISCLIGCAAGVAVSNEQQLGEGGSFQIGGNLAWAAITGALDGMLGAKILGLITTGTQTGYAAAAGAVGAIVFTLSLIGFVGVAGGTYYCCCADKSGNPALLKIPAENIKDGRIESFAGATVVDTKVVGIKATSLEDFTRQVAELQQKQAVAKHAPPATEQMSRHALALR